MSTVEGVPVQLGNTNKVTGYTTINDKIGCHNKWSINLNSTGLYFIDMNVNPKITDVARCITARHDSGVSNHRGEHSAVLIEDDPPRATLTPDRETVRQQGRRMKEPNEPMFTITAQDKHGVYHKGRIRKLMPVECWLLQGFTEEQFNKAQVTGLKDGHLYKMAGNAVSVPVITAIGQKIYEINTELGIVKE